MFCSHLPNKQTHIRTYGEHVGRLCNDGIMIAFERFNLIKIRSLGRNLADNRKRAVQDLGLILLTPTIGIRKEDYVALEPWDRYAARVAAVALSTRKAILSGFAAAAALGIRYLRPPRTHNIVELTLPGETSPSAKNNWAPKIRYLYNTLPSTDYFDHDILRVTSVERTYLDILRLYGARYALVFIEGAMNQLKISKAQMMNLVRNLSDSPYVRKALALLQLAYDNIQSVYETLARFKLITTKNSAITSIVPQARMLGQHSHYYTDLLINNWLIVEIDGECKYETNTLSVLLQERARERELLRQGYGMLRIRAVDVDKHIVTEVAHYLDKAQRVQRLAA